MQKGRGSLSHKNLRHAAWKADIISLEKSFLFARYLPKTLMKINLVALLMGLGLSSVNANTYAQQVTLKRQKASLEAVLKDFEKQSGYTFFLQKDGSRRYSRCDCGRKEYATRTGTK